MTPAELVVVPRFILWIGAAITALLALSTRRRWPDRARALRKTAPVLTLWAFFFVGSLETALHFSHETALLWQGFVGVTAILASLFLCSWVDAPKMTWGWGVLWFVSLLGHLSLSMGAEDLNAITSVTKGFYNSQYFGL